MNNTIPKRIIRFIHEHHVLTLATSFNDLPYCANCFYVWLDQEKAFVFTSDMDTHHIADVQKNDFVAGSVVLETRQVGKIRGLQIQGTLEKAGEQWYKTCRKAYLKAYPYAILKKTDLWMLRVNFLKLTDNRLGFGTKLIWGHPDAR
ncbi:MAG: pyridoxamine 5'-phosphate oxidase family protein [Bacteroidales bacterium]